MTQFRQGYLRTETDVFIAFNLALNDIELNLTDEELDTDPDDERYASATLDSVTIADGTVILHVTLRSLAGTAREVILPVATTPGVASDRARRVLTTTSDGGPMADILDVLDLSTLDPALVAQVQQQLSERMAEQFPELETKRGVIHDIVLYLTAILGAEQRTRMELLRESSSLLAISQNPTLSDETIVDKALSNFRIDARARRAGHRHDHHRAQHALAPVVVPAANRFSSGRHPVHARPGVRGADQRQRRSPRPPTACSVPLGDGTYAFSIPVTATDPGSAGMLRRGAGLTTLDPIPYFVRAYAESDFTGGFDPETNAEMLARLQGGMAAQAWSNRVTIDAVAAGHGGVLPHPPDLDHRCRRRGDAPRQAYRHAGRQLRSGRPLRPHPGRCRRRSP